LLSQLEDGSKLFEVEKNKLKNEFSSEINTLHAKIQELESTLETARTQIQTNDQSEESNNQVNINLPYFILILL
jgi:outer membrane murein-binding lipoprotein Lpp